MNNGFVFHPTAGGAAAGAAVINDSGRVGGLGGREEGAVCVCVGGGREKERSARFSSLSLSLSLSLSHSLSFFFFFFFSIHMHAALVAIRIIGFSTLTPLQNVSALSYSFLH